ncbi:MAG: TonB-dependent receptor [Gammaproteobacteria bacterium]|nr:TonB-dependent receptor [Gammaproteobacteria bacterium]
MKNYSFSGIGIKTILSSLCVALAMPVYAQESGLGSLMEEVTVTARKREEGLQDTPIAVSAFSGESLEARGIQKIDDIAQLTPNMSFDNINTNGGGGSSAAVFIRGVGQRDFLPSADPGVGLYVDGVYYARSIGSVLDLIDIERVEVLRGPQGTLFGRNTTGGAIAIHTVKPHEEFDGKLRVRVGTDDRLDVVGKVNMPISDSVFMSASLASFNQDGFVVNPLNGMDTGDDETMAFRGAVRWLVNEDVEINISGDYSMDRENGQARVTTLDPNRAINFIAPTDPMGTGNAAFTNNVFLGANSPINPANGGQGIGPGSVIPDGMGGFIPFGNLGNDPNFIRGFSACDATFANPAGTNAACANANTLGLGQNTSTLPTFSDVDVYGMSGSINWNVNDNLQVKSITAWREVDSSFAHDGDSSPFNLSYVRDEIYNQSQFSQEIQVLGTAFDDRLSWIVGGFYFTEDGLNYNPVDFPAVDIESGGGFDHESVAGFAQGTFDVTDRLHVTAGIRYTKDTKDFIVTNGEFTGLIGAVNLQVVTPAIAPTGLVIKLIDDGTTTLKADDWTPMVNIAYDWNDDLMTYFTYSEGFKSGGVQQRNAGRFGASAPTYDPEFVESFEVGFKYNHPSGNFVLNGAAFYGDYTDIQLETLAPGGIAPQLANAGEAEIKGFELEARWSPIESWFFEAALGHLDGQITGTESGLVNTGFPTVGDRLLQVPKWTMATSLIKEFGLGEMGRITARVDYNYRTKVFFAADNDPGSVMQSHGLMNASVGWDSADDHYSLIFHANNIFDKRRVLYTELSGSSATQNDILGRDFAWYLTGEYRF